MASGRVAMGAGSGNRGFAQRPRPLGSRLVVECGVSSGDSGGLASACEAQAAEDMGCPSFDGMGVMVRTSRASRRRVSVAYSQPDRASGCGCLGGAL